MADDTYTLRVLDRLRKDHYPMMVSMMAEWMRVHGDPNVLSRALQDAAKLELERIRLKAEAETAPEAGDDQ